MRVEPDNEEFGDEGVEINEKKHRLCAQSWLSKAIDFHPLHLSEIQRQAEEWGSLLGEEKEGSAVP